MNTYSFVLTVESAEPLSQLELLHIRDDFGARLQGYTTEPRLSLGASKIVLAIDSTDFENASTLEDFYAPIKQFGEERVDAFYVSLNNILVGIKGLAVLSTLRHEAQILLNQHFPEVKLISKIHKNQTNDGYTVEIVNG